MSYRDESRKDWTFPAGELGMTMERIALGAQLRAADALEKMAEPYTRLLHEAEYLRRRNVELEAETRRLARRIVSLRGVITRMKRKA